MEVGEPKEGEIRVKNKAVGLNFIDVYFRKGVYKSTLPFTPGKLFSLLFAPNIKEIEHLLSNDYIHLIISSSVRLSNFYKIGELSHF